MVVEFEKNSNAEPYLIKSSLDGAKYKDVFFFSV